MLTYLTELRDLGKNMFSCCLFVELRNILLTDQGVLNKLVFSPCTVHGNSVNIKS